MHTPASTCWNAHKQPRFIDLNIGTTPASGTEQQRTGLAVKLDAECDALLEILLEMRGLRNECAPIFALPPEVFIRIIILVAEDFSPKWCVSGDNKQRREHRKLGWIAISHVCKRWRYTCYNTRDLWAYQNLTNAYPIRRLSQPKRERRLLRCEESWIYAFQ